MIKFFRSPSAFRKWLEKNHDRAEELWVGYHKTHTKKPSLTWKQSVDEALCFGWIDGLRKSIDESSYKIRFTPRKKGSNWSAVNIARVKELERAGLMQEAGRAAFQRRISEKSKVYSYEQRKTAVLDPALAKKFKANKKAWAFFSGQPPGYRHLMTWWVVSAKKEETKLRRLERLIAESAAARRILPMAPSKR
jgi:uncharacterized protein YdeI (YjbR/CyaY-like superfamily)